MELAVLGPRLAQLVRALDALILRFADRQQVLISILF
jgi:hypothetical protein